MVNRRRPRPFVLLSLAAIAVVAAAGLLIARATRAWLEWEIQKPPERYQLTPKTFKSVEFAKNALTGKYYGWIVGDDIAGKQETFLYYNSSFWEEIDDAQLQGANTKNLSDVAQIWYEAEAQYLVWAVGDAGRIWYLYDGVSLCGPDAPAACPEPPAGNPNLKSVEAVEAAGGGAAFSVFIGAEDRIFQAGGTDSNEKLVFSSSTEVSGLVMDISALDSTHLWAVTWDGGGGKIYFNNDFGGNTWTAQASLATVNFYSVSAAAPDHVWASGFDNSGKGVVYFFDGTAWTRQLEVPDIHFQGVSAIYNPTLNTYNAFAVGNVDEETGNGTMFEYNGTIWERGDSNNDGKNLTSVAAASLTQVRAVGSQSAIIVSSPGNIFGWVWFGASTVDDLRNSIGWGSGSCANQNYCDVAGFTYGVNVRKAGANAGALSGHAWIGDADQDSYFPGDCQGGVCSSNPSVDCAPETEATDCSCSKNGAACVSTGWLSFNKKQPDGTTDEVGTPPAEPFDAPEGNPNYVPFTAKYDAQTGKVEGWGRILSLKTDALNGGWVKLRGNGLVPPPPTPDAPARDCLNCGTFCSGSLEKCELDEDCPDGETCSVEECKLCNALDDGSDAGQVVSCNACSDDGAQACTRRCSNDHATTCTQDSACGAGTCLEEYFCDTCATCDQYGVSVNDATGRITGYGWSGNGTTAGELGWIDFSRANYYSQAWLQTQYGDIYARSDIGSANTPPAPQNKCNATYVISAAGTITNYCTIGANQDPDNPNPDFPTRPYYQQNYDQIFFPDDANDYTNVLGRLDVDGTTTIVDGTKNKYGEEVFEVGALGTTSTLTDLGLCDANGVVLKRRVFHVLGDLTIGPCDAGGSMLTELKFKNGQLPDEDGSGTIVVDGDLTVDLNLTYEAGPIGDIAKLASLGLLVKGNMVVTGDVDAIVGSYVVFGPGAPEDVTPRKAVEIRNSLDERPFSAQGLLIARSFQFGRTFRGTLLDPEPAERIVYDGRVIANPPPGFRDFAKALPLIRETIPSF